MMLSPGYSYDKAPDQQHFLGRARTRRLFRAILSNRKPEWKFNMSPLFLEFLMGKRNLRLHAVGHADVQPLRLAEALLSAAGWLCGDLRGTDGDDRLGEATAPNRAIRSAPTAWCTAATKLRPCTTISARWRGFVDTVKATFFSRYPDREALRMLDEPVKPVHAPAGLVQISAGSEEAEEVGA